MTDQEFDANESENKDADSTAVNIQPSEPDAGSADEENAPGRTPGKAEGSREIVEENLTSEESE